MAGSARDVVFGMFRTPDIGAAELFGMAGQAKGDSFRRLHSAESVNDGFDIAPRIHVGLAGPVACFAASPLWWLLARSDAFEVRVFI